MRALRLTLLVAFALLAATPVAGARERWHTSVLALVPSPGFPAHAYVHPNGRIYAGTYDNPNGDTVPSRVFEYASDGALLRSWTVRGQDLSKPHGVQAATSDVRGRLLLLDKNPPRALLLDRGSGRQFNYSSFPEGAIPNYAAWGPDGSLYVTDYGLPVIWRIPPGGGPPAEWLRDARLDGGDFGTTGLNLEAGRNSLLIATQSEAGGAAGNPSSGRLWRVAIQPDGKPGPMQQVWESRPVDGPDGFAIARSGTIYMTLLAANQLVAINPDGTERERFPAEPLTGANGSSVPFDSPSSARFLGTRLIVAQQSYFAGNTSNQALLDVEAGEEGVPEHIPRNAGLRDADPPRLTRVRVSARRLRLRVNERVRLTVVVERRRGRRWRAVRRVSPMLRAGNRSVRLDLGRGAYRLTLHARDTAGNRARPLRRRLTVR